MAEKLFSTPFSFSFHVFYFFLFVCCALVSVNRSLLLRTYSHTSTRVYNGSTRKGWAGQHVFVFGVIDHVAIIR